jgi:hypothetical protein
LPDTDANSYGYRDSDSLGHSDTSSADTDGHRYRYGHTCVADAHSDGKCDSHWNTWT